MAAHVVPPDGGDTEFADMKAAYVDLSEDVKQRIEGLTAEHSIWYSRRLGGMDDVGDDAKAARPPAHHPLVNVQSSHWQAIALSRQSRITYRWLA